MLEILGKGTFGCVYRARNKKSGVIRAIKTIKKRAVDRKEQHRLISEVDILKKLDHPNIVKLYELIEDDRHYHLVTELCIGGELFDRIMEDGHFSETDAAGYIHDIFSAVNVLHSNNIVHRDIKPENLLIKSNLLQFLYPILLIWRQCGISPNI